MTNEELILQKIENLEAQLAPLLKTARDMNELKEDVLPLTNSAVKVLIEELQEIESGFQLDDLMYLAKETARNISNFTFAIKQMSNIIDFVNDLEPLMKSAVPQIIEYLDQLERRGVFRILGAMVDVRAKVAAKYDADDIDQIGDAMVSLLGLAKKVSDPKAIEFLEKTAALPSQVDLENCKPVGAFGLMSAGFNSEVKQGLGLALELTKALGRIKDNGNGAGSTAEPEQIEKKST